MPLRLGGWGIGPNVGSTHSGAQWSAVAPRHRVAFSATALLLGCGFTARIICDWVAYLFDASYFVSNVPIAPTRTGAGEWRNLASFLCLWCSWHLAGSACPVCSWYLWGGGGGGLIWNTRHLDTTKVCQIMPRYTRGANSGRGEFCGENFARLRNFPRSELRLL